MGQLTANCCILVEFFPSFVVFSSQQTWSKSSEFA